MNPLTCSTAAGCGFAFSLRVRKHLEVGSVDALGEISWKRPKLEINVRMLCIRNPVSVGLASGLQ